ncbi:MULTISPECIES: hypothetical protein [unclassified Luteibacter]|uniref:hypothetical protein n=1 Tax=Luteibacter sp. PvP019 TaxID=3156436 RepID=UPI0033959A7A
MARDFRIASFLAVASFVGGVHAESPDRDKAQVIPTVYEAGHFFAVPETADGQRLRLLVDTGGGGGGGMYWISKAAAQRLHLTIRECALGDEKALVAPLPRFKAGRGLPLMDRGPCGASLMVVTGAPDTDDGQLGAGYLSQSIWTFDYPAQRLMLEGKAWRPEATAHKVPLGFPHDKDRHRASGFPRVSIRVDGQSLDMLLDTGASSYPTAAAVKTSGTPTVRGEGVTSYITTTVFERWHVAHPEWRVVEHADDKVAAKPLGRIIEVPEVEIAGWKVGPVWFTEQPDRAFHVFMAQFMDKPTEGAAGGNIFQHFAMTLDYAHESAYFRCVQGCR